MNTLNTRKIITTLLVSIILLVSFILPTYATTQNEVNQPKSETTTPIPQDTRNGDLTKSSSFAGDTTFLSITKYSLIFLSLDLM